MRGFCYFTPEEHATRLNNVRSKMEEYNFDACLITSPENIYYLIGLDHQGYFGPHILIVPRQDGMIIVARAHEVTTCERQAGNAIFKGYSDTQEAGKFVSEILKKMNLGNANIGIQKASLCFPPTISDSLKDNLPEVKWGDANGLVESFRMIKSSREIQYIKKSANISDKMMQKAIDTAGEGVSEKEIAACIHEVMIREGGEPPGFGPFVRSAERLPYEHEIWSDRILQKGDQVILEMAASFKRYHSPMGRLIYVDKAPDGTVEVEKICIEAQNETIESMKPGISFAAVYDTWQDVIDRNGLSHYRRHHCGYSVGIAFHPSWTGGIGVVSLHDKSDLIIKSGMVFHQLSWLLGCGKGDYFVSDTVYVNENGGERLTNTSRNLSIV